MSYYIVCANGRFTLMAGSVTVLGSKKEGDYVNVEIEAQTQAIVDTVEKVVARYLKEGNLKASSGSP